MNGKSKKKIQASFDLKTSKQQLINLTAAAQPSQFFSAKLTERGAPKQHRQVIAAALFTDIILTSLIC